MTLTCSRCGACLKGLNKRPGYTRACLKESCAGTMRRVLVNDLKRDAKAKQDLRQLGSVRA